MSKDVLELIHTYTVAIIVQQFKIIANQEMVRGHLKWGPTMVQPNFFQAILQYFFA